MSREVFLCGDPKEFLDGVLRNTKAGSFDPAFCFGEEISS
jgi:hypothetical protein